MTSDQPQPAPLSGARPDDARLASRHSLRVRLPLLTSALIVVVVAVVLTSAYREMESTLIRTGGDRAKAAADQLSNLLGRSSQQGISQLRRVAEDPSLRRYLEHPTPAGRDEARLRLESLATGGARSVELWRQGGERLLQVLRPAGDGTARPGTPPAVPPPTVPLPSAVGFGPLQAYDNAVFSDVVVEVPAEPITPSEPPDPGRIGYLRVRSTIAVSPPGILARLVGGDAAIAIGNVAGGSWTDLSRTVPAPPVDVTRNDVSRYTAPGGEKRLGATSLIRGTPWVVWVDFPESVIVAPARVFLRRMSLVALLVVVISALLVRNMSTRMIRPLERLVQAADEIAAGDYSPRISEPGRDEIGRLSRAFNAMGANVKDATDQLRKSERTLAATLASLHEGVVIADPDGRLVYANAVAERILGASIVGAPVEEWPRYWQFFNPDETTELPRDQWPLVRALNGEDAWDVELFVRSATSAGGTHISLNAGALRDSDGSSKGAVASFRDISLRRHLDEERARTAQMELLSRQAQSASRLKSEFLANMSHELRTPLNSIIGFAEFMHKGKAGPVSADHAEYLGDILTSSRHLLQLINDVLDLSKVESGKMELRPEPVDLAKLVEGVRDVLRDLAAAKRLRVDTQLAPDVTSVVVDPVRVKQILYNYLSNAIKFTGEGGKVVVRVSGDEPDFFRIDVEDTGPGISSADLSKLFVEFQQLDAGAAKQHQGTGLGLALTKRLAETHGGRVAVHSTPGLGSTFSVILPRVTNGSPVQAARPPAAVPEPVLDVASNNRTILVVDDNPAALKLADVALRELGFRTICRTNGEDALVAAATDPPAAVVLDLLMPHLDGFEFIDRLRSTASGRDVPVIVWTVKDVDAVERRQLHAGAAVIVSKRAGGVQTLVEELRRLEPAVLASPGHSHDG